MPTRKTRPHQIDINGSAEQGEGLRPSGPPEKRDIIDLLQTANAGARGSGLEGLAATIGALLERLGYRGSLGWYAADRSTGKWVPTDWAWDHDLPRLPAEARAMGWTATRISIHPALVWEIDDPRRERRAARMLADALNLIAFSNTCASRGEVQAAQR